MRPELAFGGMFDRPHEIIKQIVRNVEKVIVGKTEMIEKSVTALLCGGHILLEDVPGVGKTMLARALAATFGCTCKRIQFTSDMLPGDVIGASVYNQKTGEFVFREGPVMANIVLADEINRASPKTQSALLECMEEKCVTVDGGTYPLPDPFIVVATQNPPHLLGTSTLPEAQMDRFLLRLKMGYPESGQEVDMLDLISAEHPVSRLKPVIAVEEWREIQLAVRSVFVDADIKQLIVHLAQQTRIHPDVLLGVSPRGSGALLKAAQAWAWMHERDFVVPDDVLYFAPDVLTHRLMLRPEAEMDGKTADDILREAVQKTAVPHIGGKDFGLMRRHEGSGRRANRTVGVWE
ncbi:MAG TPA: MoxR family ATPase [Bacilli bacterium]